MALIFMDGFDKYGGANTDGAIVSPLMQAGEWSAVNTGVNLVNSLSLTPGFAMRMPNGTNACSKTLSANYPRLIGGFRFNSNLTSGAGIRFSDGATAQASITIDATGTISVIRGPVSAPVAVLSTSTTLLIAGQTYHLEFDITFSNTGAFLVYLDGIQIINSSNDTTVTANNYANAVAFTGNSSVVCLVDDFYLMDNTGSTNNAVFLNAPRIETTFPTSDNAVQFSFGAATLGPTQRRSNSNSSAVANTLYLLGFTPARSCTLNSISFIPATTNATIQFRPVIYADVGGVPTTLLSTGATVVGTTANTTITMPLTTPQSLVAGTQYWLGFMDDIASSNIFWIYDSTVTLGRSATSTFASGAPGTAPTMTLGASTILLWGNVTGTGVNWYEVSPNPRANPPPTINLQYVASSTVGHEDLYGMSALSATPLNIYATAVKAYLGKSDSGPRTCSVHLKSGAVDAAGPAYQPLTVYNWAAAYYELNPDGNVAWTPTALNAATAGYKIDA